MFTNCCDNGGDSADCTVDDMACNKKKGSEGHRCKGTLQNPRFQSAFMQLNKKNNALSFCFMLLSPRNLLYPCFENISNETMMWGEARCSKRVKYKGAIGGEGTANRGGCSGGKLRNTTPVNVCGVVITRTVGGILQEVIEQ